MAREPKFEQTDEGQAAILRLWDRFDEMLAELFMFTDGRVLKIMAELGDATPAFRRVARETLKARRE